jgi:hypothetical protein
MIAVNHMRVREISYIFQKYISGFVFFCRKSLNGKILSRFHITYWTFFVQHFSDVGNKRVQNYYKKKENKKNNCYK